MPPQRTPLRPTSGNRQKGDELSPYERGRIIGALESGAKPRAVARRVKASLSTIKYTLKSQKKRVEGASQPRKPRGKSYTDTDVRHLLRFVRSTPKATYAETKLATGVSCSQRTIKRILADNGITNWRVKRHPQLLEAHAAKRLT